MGFLYPRANPINRKDEFGIKVCRAIINSLKIMSIICFKMKEGLNEDEKLYLVEKIIEYFSVRDIPIHVNIRPPELSCYGCGHIEDEDYWIGEAQRFQIKDCVHETFESCDDGDHVECPNCSKIIHIEYDLNEVD